MAKARPIPGLAPDTRFGDAAAAAVILQDYLDRAAAPEGPVSL